MSESSGSERRPAKYGDLDLGRVHTAQTVDAFLEMLNLSNLGETFRRANVTSVDHLLRLVPGDLDTMGIRLAGVRVRLQKGLCLLREQQQPEPSVAASPAGSGARGDVPGASVDVTMSPADSSHGTGETVKFNSTSSLYIDSTISNPDMAQICFCVSLLVHDLIQEAEAGRHEMSLGMSSGEQDPFSLFQPRDIFALPGKRSREEFETNAPVELEIPTDHDIRLSIQAIHRLSRFSPGVLVVAMIYIERLRRRVGAELLASTWQPTLLIAIIVAQKVWEDKRYMNVDFTTLCPALTLQQLNHIEVQFLQLLDYNVCVSAAVYTEWYFKLCDLCERNSVRLKPLGASEAAYLEICSDLLSTRWHGDMLAKSGPAVVGAGLPTPRSRAVVNNVG